MKIKYNNGDITIRGVGFGAKPVEVTDESLIAKVLGIPGFEQVKRGPKGKANDQDAS